MNFLWYSFAIGGDGKVYEGRGFNKIGAHAPIYNTNSIGIVLIGNWESKLICESCISIDKADFNKILYISYLNF